MKRISILTFNLLLVVLCSCNKEVGNYFYDDGSYYHIDSSCGDESKSIVEAHDVYTNVYKFRGEYGYRDYLGGIQRIIHFCAQCINDEQMKQIEDSIAKYKHYE